MIGGAINAVLSDIRAETEQAEVSVQAIEEVSDET
jgi:hypothetical protein